MLAEIAIIALWIVLAWAVSAEIRAQRSARALGYLTEAWRTAIKARDMFKESLDLLAADYSALQAEHREKRLRDRDRRSAAGAKGHQTRRKRAELRAFYQSGGTETEVG